MSSDEPTGATLSVDHIGGIEKADVQFTPGISILVGRNATNRTSLLNAFNAALGGEMGSVNVHSEDDKGHVTLELGGETYTRDLTLHRGENVEGNTTTYTGDPYSDDPEVVDTFVTLLESNRIRSAIKQNVDNLESRLAEYIMSALDVDELKARADELKNKKDELQAEHDRLNEERKERQTLAREENKLEDEIEALEDDIEGLVTEIESVQEEIDEIDASKEDTERAEELYEELTNLRNKVESAEEDIEAYQNSLENIPERKEQLQEEIEELKDSLSAKNIASLEEKIEELEKDRRWYESMEGTLRDAARANQSLINDERFLEELQESVEAGEQTELTEQLSPEAAQEKVSCLMCGTAVTEEELEEHTDKLRERARSYMDEKKELKSQISSLRKEKKNITSKKSKIQSKEQELASLEDERKSIESSIEDAKERRDDLQEEIEELEEEVEDLEENRDSRVIELHEQRSDLRTKKDRKQRKLERKKDRLEEVREKQEELTVKKERLDEVKQEIEEVGNEIEELKGRVTKTEFAASNEMSDRAEEVLNILDYGNIDGVNISHQTSKKPFEIDSEFRLTVVRDGKTDSLDNLSESEREVVGLAVALAGNLVHEVYQQIPVMLLDSLEPIDSQRIADLVNYFDGHVDYLVVSLLPEDANALSDEYQRISSDQLQAPTP